MSALVVIVLMVASMFALGVGNPDWDLIDTALDVAERSIAAIAKRRQYLYDDIFVGLTMTMDQLGLTIHLLETSQPDQAAIGSRSLPGDDRWGETLQRSKALANATAGLHNWGIVMLQSVADPQHMMGMLPLVRPGSWSFDFSDMRTNSSLVTPPRDLRPFSEDFSDSCIYKLTQTRSPEKCAISDACFKVMTNPYTTGYWLTHEVFYVLIGIMSQCRGRLLSLLAEHRGGVKNFLIETCSNIMRDVLIATQHGYPERLQDLFIEQIGFCGLAGFPEFYQPEWIRRIRSWERKDGCFSDHRTWGLQNSFESKWSLLRNKRSEIFLKDDCRFHKTILGAITMTTGLKFLLR
ncbi:unnamed protein product [Ixodes hexagonus]